MQGYQLVGPGLDVMVAKCVPWIEFLLGVFLFLGLWIQIVLKALWAMIVVFIFVLGQAIFRNLPIKECGCFGGLFSVPLPVTLLFDSSLLIAVSFLKAFIDQTSQKSLDGYFSKKK